MVWAGLLLVSALFGPVTPDEARRAAAEVFGDERIEKQWPDERRPPEPPPREPGAQGPPPRDPRGAPAAPPRETRSDSSGSGSSEGSTAFLWILLGIGAAVAIYQLVRAWQGPAARNVLVPDAKGQPRADVGVQAPPPDAAELLAGEGRYDEAVHTLLLLALAAVGRTSFHDTSLTSREVAAASRIEGAGASSLTALVRAVEVSRFGGRALGRAEYEASREHLASVRAALAGSTA